METYKKDKIVKFLENIDALEYILDIINSHDRLSYENRLLRIENEQLRQQLENAIPTTIH